jgi:hypothetical protein
MKKITTLLFILAIVANVFSQTTVGMVAYYTLNGNITDAGPNGINGTNFGATATTNKAGTANSAMNFSNPSSTVPQYATLPVNATTSFGTNQNFTIAFAVFANSPYVHTGGFYDNNLNYGGPGVWFWNANGYPQVQFNFKNNSVGTTNGAFPVGVWKHVAAVRNNGTLSIYINGVLNASATEGTTAPVYSFPARIGTMFFNGMAPPQYNGLNGKMDELRIYNRALSAAEILVLSSTALPIKLTSFTATTQYSNVLLKWQTASESNTQYYLVQRSTNGTNFTNIASVNAKGNSTTTTNYTYTDGNIISNINSPIIYYRLQSVDIDGKTQYSPVVSVATTTKKEGAIVLQNPVKNNIALQITSSTAQQASIIISNSLGQVVSNTNYNLLQGTTSLNINSTNFSKGIYYVTVHYNNTKQTLSVLKE